MIRQLTVDDIDAFREIREEAIRTNPESFKSPEEEQGGDLQDTAYRNHLKNDLWGEFDNGALVGTIGFHIHAEKNYGQIFGMYVRSAHRNKGSGNRLIQGVLKAADNRVNQIQVCAVHTAEAAIKLFLNNGFEICHTDTDAFSVGDVNYKEHLLVKKLR